MCSTVYLLTQNFKFPKFQYFLIWQLDEGKNAIGSSKLLVLKINIAKIGGENSPNHLFPRKIDLDAKIVRLEIKISANLFHLLKSLLPKFTIFALISL